MKLAKCQLGTTCTIEESPYTAARPDITRFAVITSIYNTGDLAASKLKGNWNLSCSQSEYDFSLPLWIDSVSKAFPYNLKPHALASNEITQAIRNGQVSIKVDIEFDFSGLEDESPERYKAGYEYRHQQHQMVRIY
jgi:hypothetical protein